MKMLAMETFKSAMFKVLAVVASLIIVRVLVNRLGFEYYGIWAALSSIATWIFLFDFGLGKEVKNQIARARTKIEINNHVRTISIAYITQLIIVAVVIAILTILYYNEFFMKVVFIEELEDSTEAFLLFLLVTGISLILPFKLIIEIWSGFMQPSVANSTQAYINIVQVIFIIIFSMFASLSLHALVFNTIFSAALIYVYYTVKFFSVRPHFLPTAKNFRFSLALVSLKNGGKFLLLQICSLILLSSDRILIAYTSNTKEVAYYDIYMRYFVFVYIFFLTVNGPLWPFYTKALAHKKTNWVLRQIYQKIILAIVCFIFLIMLHQISADVIYFWLGQSNTMDYVLSALVALMVGQMIWSSVFSTLLNAAGILNVQIYIAFVSAFINIPLSLYLGEIYGARGVVFASCVSLLIFSICGPIVTLQTLNVGRRV